MPYPDSRLLATVREADIAGADDRCRVLTRWRKQLGKDEVDLAS